MVKKRWQIFEQQSLKYLETKYPNNVYKIIGGSNSTMGDIQVFNESHIHLYDIEIKLCPSQAGQFVICDEGTCFSYSKRNKHQQNIYSSSIISYINKNFERFQGVTQSSIPILVNEDILYNYLISHFKNKNCKYIIASNGLNSEIFHFPIEKIPEYLIVNAYLRRKKSGSRKLPKKEYSIASSLLQTSYSHLPGIIELGKDLLYQPDTPLDTTNLYFGDSYYLSEIKENTYKVRKISKTNNPNVIFSLQIKKAHSDKE